VTKAPEELANAAVLASHQRQRTVLVGEDDVSGLIYFPTYYHYMSEGDQELFSKLGHPVWEQLRSGIAAPAVHTEVDYLAPARAGDELVHRITMYAGRRTSTCTVHEFIRADGAMAARGLIVRAWVEMDGMTATPIPDWLSAVSDALR
jgi:acyl-CoA thioesterase FadM